MIAVLLVTGLVLSVALGLFFRFPPKRIAGTFAAFLAWSAFLLSLVYFTGGRV
jgi:hypothetical protein